MRFLPSCNCVHTTIWMNHIDTKKTFSKKSRWELDKNFACCLEQVLGVVLHKTASVQPFASHNINHPSKTNKTCRAQLEKQGRTHNSLMDSCTCTCQYWVTNKGLHQLSKDIACNREDQPGVMDDKD